MTVACRTTFALRPGQMETAAIQHEPVDGDRGYPGRANAGVYVPNDLVPMKPRVDVLLVGSAFAPQRQPVRAIIARLAVGGIDKRVEIRSDRALSPDGRLPLTGAVQAPARGERDPSGGVVVPHSKPSSSVGFGPVLATAPDRRALLGSAASELRTDNFRGQILPMDVDISYFNVAPRDQQIQSLAADTTLILENLNPDYTELVTRLPGIQPIAIVDVANKVPQRIVMRADTLWIDTSLGICAVTWRAQIPIDTDQALRVLVTTEEGTSSARPHGGAVPPRSAGENPLAETAAMTTSPKRKTLPFRPSDAPAAAAQPLWSSSPPPPLHPAPPPLVTARPLPELSLSAPAIAPASPVSPWALGAIVPRWETIPPEAIPMAQLPALMSPPPPPPKDVLSLVGFVPDGVAEIRNSARFKSVLDAVEQRFHARDSTERDDYEGEDDKPADYEDRRDVFEILAASEPTAAAELESVLRSEVRTDRRLVHPVVLLAGELLIPFDELEILKAVIAIAAPKAGTNPAASEAVGMAKTFVSSPGPHARSACAVLTDRIREVMTTQKLVLDGYLDEQTTTALLEARVLAQRDVLGETHVRALFHCEVSEADRNQMDRLHARKDAPKPVPVYLSTALWSKLPSVERLRVRMLARIHPAVDPAESSTLALCALAAAIVLPPLVVD